MLSRPCVHNPRNVLPGACSPRHGNRFLQPPVSSDLRKPVEVACLASVARVCWHATWANLMFDAYCSNRGSASHLDVVIMHAVASLLLLKCPSGIVQDLHACRHLVAVRSVD